MTLHTKLSISRKLLGVRRVYGSLDVNETYVKIFSRSHIIKHVFHTNCALLNEFRPAAGYLAFLLHESAS